MFLFSNLIVRLDLFYFDLVHLSDSVGLFVDLRGLSVHLGRLFVLAVTLVLKRLGLNLFGLNSFYLWWFFFNLRSDRFMSNR